MSTTPRFPETVIFPDRPYRMASLEIAGGLVAGFDPSVAPLAHPSGPLIDPLQALEAELLPALRSSPCLVAFSGGRDSSAVLAAAVSAARRHGVPDPVPATNRFPEDPSVDENKWQEIVVAHLGLKDWIRVDVRDEVDIVGPLAKPWLRSHGPLWPPNFHFLSTFESFVTGGALITGNGGDEVLSPSVAHTTRVLAGERQLSRGDLLPIVKTALPRTIRRRRTATRVSVLPWLRPDVSRARSFALAHERSGPRWWGAQMLGSYWRSRSRLAGNATMQNATAGKPWLFHPLMSAPFLEAVTRERWRTGFKTRNAAMKAIFGSLLPDEILYRQGKAAFFQPFINRHSRAFIAAWNGSGVDPELVDIDQLRRAWNAPQVDARAYSLLQSAWVANQISPGV